jgi:hypothetical protein
MKRSEIFESFVKIAQEKGMINNDSSDSKKKLEQNPRADSLDLKRIESLYGNKPDTGKGMEYKKNIMEIAHPGNMVISPSYDKLNGLVENNIERQNILLHIVQKTPDGLLTQRKYAEQQLLLSLIRVGNELDGTKQTQLKTLSNTCFNQVNSGQITKTAQDPITLGIAATVAIIGGIYLKNHMRFISDGMEKDHDKLIAEINDMLESSTDWGVGYQYKADFVQTLQDLKSKVETHYAIYQKIAPMLDALQKPRDADEIEELKKKPETTKIIDTYNEFYTATKKLMPFLLTVQKDFGSEMYKQRQIEDKGWMTSLVDKMQIFHGGAGLVADDFDDVRHALETYLLDIQNLMKAFAGVENLKKKVTQDLEQANAKTTSMFGTPKADKPDMPETPASPGTKSVKDLDQESEDLAKQLSGLGFS